MREGERREDCATQRRGGEVFSTRGLSEERTSLGSFVVAIKIGGNREVLGGDLKGARPGGMKRKVVVLRRAEKRWRS